MKTLTMGNTERHIEILDWFSEFANKEKRKNPRFKSGREQMALVENHGKLIDISRLTEDGRRILGDIIGRLNHTYPDFMIFYNNPVFINNNKTRYAGIPDLIIEVWSLSNTEDEKKLKRDLYRTEKSEFWELDQDSPKIICWNKDGKMYEQHLDKPVKTPWGAQLDLTELAYDVVDILPNDRFRGGPYTGESFDLPMIDEQ